MSPRRLYSRLAPLYDAFAVRVGSRARRELVHRVAPDADARVLDAGTGTGLLIPRLCDAAAGVQVDAIDATPAMLSRARRRCAAYGDRVRLHRGDVRALPFGDAVFDAAACAYTLDVLPPGDAGTALRELRRVVRPGGVVAVATLAPARSWTARVWTALARTAPVVLGGAYPTRPDALLRHAGFDAVGSRYLEDYALPSIVAWSST